MAKYTSDTNLIRGAAAVGQSMMPTDLSGLDKITKAGTDMMDKASKDVEAEIKKRDELKKKFDDSSEAVLLRSGALGGKLYDATVEKVKKLRLSYIDGIVNKDEKQKMNALVALNNHSIFIQDHKQTNVDIADLRTKGKLSSYYEKNARGREKTSIMTQIQDQTYVDVTTDETTGEEVFHVRGLDKETGELNDEIIKVSNKQYKKMASTLRNYTTGNQYINTLNAVKKDEAFSDDMFRQGIRQGLPKTKEEWDAAAYDDISGTNLQDMLNDSGTLDQEILMSIDPKVWDLDNDPKTLNKEEKAAFIDAVVNTENDFFNLGVSNQILEDQLTNAGRASHEKHWLDINNKKQEILDRQVNANKSKGLHLPHGYMEHPQIEAEYNYLGSGNEGDIFQFKYNERDLTVTRQKDGAWKYNDGTETGVIFTPNQIKGARGLHHLENFAEPAGGYTTPRTKEEIEAAEIEAKNKIPLPNRDITSEEYLESDEQAIADKLKETYQAYGDFKFEYSRRDLLRMIAPDGTVGTVKLNRRGGGNNKESQNKIRDFIYKNSKEKANTEFNSTTP